MELGLHPVQSRTCEFSQRCCRSFLANLPDGIEVLDRPEEADLILVFDSYDERIIRELPWGFLLSPRTVMYSQGDAGVPVLPGLYVNLTRKIHVPGMTASHGYFEYLAETGGNRFCKNHLPREKSYLFCFSGRNSHPVRDRVLRFLEGFPNAIVQDTSEVYNHWSPSRPEDAQSAYVEQIRQASFSICPRGKGANCIRLFESMRMGVAPVLISDDLVLPDGPDWETFLLRVPENRIEDIPAILEREQHRAGEMGHLARAAYESHFSPESMPRRILEQLREISVRGKTGVSGRLVRWGKHRVVGVFWDLYFLLVDFRDWIRGILLP
ncbi:exostosin family protein [Puniceicoccales bacterium CK1056]|uniref:Exostosin family protein n=1 Tax=Oceanipulchritudo coccoides TaxID=2706888 RepID=A0A6B2M4P2_9BACT|nr:exostosin family protein [Oceanipulchritudo coccoides]NDV62600.1 exostosin family protein [Oceanipulchritudo coccoides]